MNEQTPPSTEEPTVVSEPPQSAPPAAAPSEPPSRNTLIAGGTVIAVICGLIGYQLGDNSNSDLAGQRMAGPGRGNQQQMMPPGAQGQGFQQDRQQGQRDGQDQQGPPTSGGS